MAVNERIIIFGDTRGMKPQDIHVAVEALQPELEASYLRHDDTLPDEQLIQETERLFTDAGILNPPHPIICRSDEEKVERVMNQLREREKGDEVYIIERDPKSLVEAFKHSPFAPTDTLSSTTVLAVSSTYPFDYRDKDTGIRVVSFPNTPYRFPTHPTPAS